MKVLLVEDNDIVRQILGMFLAQLGHNVIEADDGLNGIIHFLDHDNINAVLTDIHMPKMNGILLTKIIHGLNPSLPIIGISANYSEHEKEAMLAAGACYVNHKPCTITELGMLLKQWCND